MSDEYTPSIYEPNGIVEGFHGVPRFNHSKDITVLFSDDSSASIDYVLSTIFISCFLMALFLCMVILLIAFTFMGKDRVGFLSGYAMSGEKSSHGISSCTTVANVRLAFLFSCMCVIGMTILSTFIFGLNDLKIALEEIGQSALDIRNLAFDARVQTTSLNTLGEYSSTLREIILPDVRYPSFCVNTALDSLTGLPFNEMRQQAVADLEALGDFNADTLKGMNDVLFEEMISRSEESWNFFSLFGIKEWQMLTYVISYCTIAILMAGSTIFTWAEQPSNFFICTSTWFLLPIFIVTVTLTWLVVSAFGIAAVMNADFCIGDPTMGGPDSTTMNILQQSQIKNQSELLFDASVYWFNGCQSEFPFTFIDNYEQQLNASITSMQTLQDMMQNVTIGELEQICGVIGDFDAIDQYFDRLKQNFLQMSSSSSSVSDMLRCESVNSIYIDAVHENACTNVPRALLWSFSALLIVSFIGMLMIMLRPAWLKVREIKTKTKGEMPIISVERIQDLEEENVNDSPSPQYNRESISRNQRHDHTNQYIEFESDHIRLNETENLQPNNVPPEQNDHDPVAMYQITSVADETLEEIPISPKDPRGYRVY